jgi:hypothetical protein
MFEGAMHQQANTTRYELSRLAREAKLHLESRQRRIDLLLRNHERASLNGDTGVLTLSARKLPLLSTRVVLVGSHDRQKKTFRWGWADPSAPHALVEPLDDMRAVGEARGFSELTEGEISASAEEAADMASITALVLDGRGTHRVEDEEGRSTFFVLLDPIAFESLPPAAGGEW